MALSCSLNKDLLKGKTCDYVLQSVTEIYLADYTDSKITRTPVTGDGACGESVTAIALASGTEWYRIQPAKGTASFTDVLNVTDSGNKYRTHSLSFSVSGKYDAEMACVIDGLSLGSYLAIAVFADGSAVLLGDEKVGLEATVVTNTGSASATEASGISVEMSADLTVTALPIADVDAIVNPGAGE